MPGETQAGRSQVRVTTSEAVLWPLDTHTCIHKCMHRHIPTHTQKGTDLGGGLLKPLRFLSETYPVSFSPSFFFLQQDVATSFIFLVYTFFVDSLGWVELFVSTKAAAQTHFRHLFLVCNLGSPQTHHPPASASQVVKDYRCNPSRFTISPFGGGGGTVRLWQAHSVEQLTWNSRYSCLSSDGITGPCHYVQMEAHLPQLPSLSTLTDLHLVLSLLYSCSGPLLVWTISNFKFHCKKHVTEHRFNELEHGRGTHLLFTLRWQPSLPRNMPATYIQCLHIHTR